MDELITSGEELMELTFGERIKKERLMRGMNINQARLDIGCSYASLQNWEGDVSVPRGKYMERLKEYYGLDKDDIGPGTVRENGDDSERFNGSVFIDDPYRSNEESIKRFTQHVDEVLEDNKPVYQKPIEFLHEARNAAIQAINSKLEGATPIERAVFLKAIKVLEGICIYLAEISIVDEAF